MEDVYITGVGMTRFGKYLETSMKTLAGTALDRALEDAGVAKGAIQAAFVGNAMAGLITGQECIRGQVVLRANGIGDIPVVNVENACASSSTAAHLAWMAVASGMYDCVLALGVEKLYDQDKKKSFRALGSAVDVEFMAEIMKSMKQSEASVTGKDAGGGAGEKRSMFMDFYAMAARRHMEAYGTTKEQFAKVAAKNACNGALNPNAQYQQTRSVEDVLAAPVVAEPLTRLMCSPIGDGAAAAIFCSEDMAARTAAKHKVKVAASVLRSGKDRDFDEEDVVVRASRQAYETAGIDPQDVRVAEVHDASAPAELMYYEELGLCAKGEGGRFIDEGHPYVNGSCPVNPSGGLTAKGHPVGATGIAQLAELTWQLRGEAGQRQAQNKPNVALAQNGGGNIGIEAAAMAVHLLTI